NYDVTSIDGTLTVGKAILSVTAADKSKVYGATNPVLTGTIVGLQNGDAVTASYSTSATAASAVGSYTIVPTAVDSIPATLSNYDLSLVNATLTVGKAALSVTADNKNRLYGEANPVFTGTLLGVQNSDNISASYSTVATQASAFGTYPIVPALADPDHKLANYDVTSIDGTLTVGKAALSSTAEDKSRRYG